MELQQKVFGLIGRNIGYSFSKSYFTKKFAALQYDSHSYQNFDIANISELATIKNTHGLSGLNVTIPYKESIIPFLDSISENAAKIGAVNTIKILDNGKLKGYNTDWHGFQLSIKPLLQPHHQMALILGTGGASKAVAFALDKLGIGYKMVSRKESETAIAYEQLNEATFNTHQIIINCTPIGTHPNTSEAPIIPYEFFTSNHIAFDLIYNPAETEFLNRASAKGATIKNGYDMLVLQAEKAWEIWNRKIYPRS